MTMKIKTLKTTGISIALAAAFLVAAGSSAFAQDRRDGYGYGAIDSRWQGVEYQRGIDDGRIAGKRDALAHFSFSPAGSIRYQQRGTDYRQGFQKGYAQTYRQFADNDRYRDDARYRDNDYRNGYRDGYRNDQSRQGGYYDRSGNFHSY
jgi:hypothetical protein